MPAKKQMLSLGMLGVWSVILTALTGVFGAVPLRALRLAGGAWAYWAMSLLFSGALMAVGWSLQAAAFMVMVIVVGIFSEVEERDHALGSSAVAAVGVTTLISASVFAFWASRRGPSWQGDLIKMIEARFADLGELAQRIQIEPSDVLLQLPALFVIYLSVALFLSLLLQRRVLASIGLRASHTLRLSQFTLPDLMMWALIVGLGATFLAGEKSGIRAVGMNLLQVVMMSYFFQGLAVLVRALQSLRVGSFMRLVLIVLITSQLFLLLSVLGISDYWLDWRSRLDRKRGEEKKSRHV